MGLDAQFNLGVLRVVSASEGSRSPVPARQEVREEERQRGSEGEGLRGRGQDPDPLSLLGVFIFPASARAYPLRSLALTHSGAHANPRRGRWGRGRGLRRSNAPSLPPARHHASTAATVLEFECLAGQSSLPVVAACLFTFSRCDMLRFVCAIPAILNRLNKMLGAWQWDEAHEYNDSSASSDSDLALEEEEEEEEEDTWPLANI